MLADESHSIEELFQHPRLLTPTISIVRELPRTFGRVERSYNKLEDSNEPTRCCGCRVSCILRGARSGPLHSSAKAAVDNNSRRILAALKAASIDDKDIQTAYLDMQPTSYYEKHVRINNFTATQSLSVTIRDLSRLDNVMDAVMSAGANRIDGIEYQSSELRKYRDQARDEATKAAKEKAVALAQALGNQVGKTYSIEEVQQWEGYSMIGGPAANVALDRTVPRPPPSTAPGQLTVTASVIVSFDLL
jgi:uncharacterized protein